jgi:uncharacterized protein
MTSTALPSAESLIRQHLELVIHDHPRWLELFDEAAVVEFPYAVALGTPSRFEGKAAIDAYFSRAGSLFLDFRFRELRVHASEATGVAFAEGHGSARIATTGRPYEQDYVMVIEARDGKILRYREYWNPLPAIEAFGGQEALAAMGRSS